jgi:GNAT superfamily N-acetyltransferase
VSEFAVYRAAQPGLLWARYARDFGEERLRDVFGPNWPPADARHGEEVWVFRDVASSPRPFDPQDHPLAWLSLARDQFDPEYFHMSRGVWPSQHGRGLGRAMREWATGRATVLGGKYLLIHVNRSNPEHLANCLKDPYWRTVAEWFDPPGAVCCHDLVKP